jgi:hypothetical protein
MFALPLFWSVLVATCSGEESLSSRAIGCCELDCDDYCMYYNDTFLKASKNEQKEFSVRRCTGGA